MKCQKNKFIITGKKTYLNCAYMSPMLKKVEKAGINGLKIKRAPHKLQPSDFFTGVESLRKKFSALINSPNDERIVLIPSVSYGMANVTNNIKITSSQNIILIGDQFPSNVYPWTALAKKNKAKLKFVEKPTTSNCGREWNDKILTAIDNHTKVVSMGVVHWADGTIFDLKKIRKRTREVGALLIIDGTQSIGAMPFDLQKIEPDALVCAAYKWLMGPYGFGVAYYGNYFDGGSPIEESWINRKNSEDFSQLINYQDEYAPGARRYAMGQQSSFINVQMLSAGISQIQKWGVENMYKYITDITRPCFDLLDKSKVWYEEDKYRSSHLFGIKPKKNLQKVLQKIKEEKIHVSLRGDSIRVSPSVYNKKEEIERLFNCISNNA